VRGEQQLRELADTQAALRRLAMLAARSEPPEAVFAAATREALRHFGNGTARMIRYEPDGTATLAASKGRPANLSTHTELARRDRTFVPARPGRPS
jgi:hypothetical protein